jgi:murein DD-endopeptidase
MMAGSASAQTHSAFPVEILSGPSTQPFMADGKLRLMYELHITNFSPRAVDLNGLEVLGDKAAPLASYKGDALEKMLYSAGSDVSAPDATPEDKASRSHTIAGGRRLIVFVDLALPADTHMPAELHHRFTLSIAGKDGAAIEKQVDAAPVPIKQEPVLVLRAPLKGTGWVAANALGSVDHRRSFVPVDGRYRIAQRFAIDWVQVGPDGNFFHGDAKSNKNFYGYGAQVFAVADAVVSDMKDGLAENIGSSERAERNITLDNIVGNYLMLDIGHGRFALYAHLQPGSMKVKTGDKVKAGQVLALLGNSGNSDAPHLHFQITDANSPLASEGQPYELETFTQNGIDEGTDSMDPSKPWHAEPGAKPVIHRHEFPVDNAVVDLP